MSGILVRSTEKQNQQNAYLYYRGYFRLSHMITNAEKFHSNYFQAKESEKMIPIEFKKTEA